MSEESTVYQYKRLTENLRKIEGKNELKTATVAWNVYIFHQYELIYEKLKSENIICKPIKGIYIEKNYRAKRLIGDIDLIIDAAQKKKVIQILKKSGYKDKTNAYDTLRIKTTLKNNEKRIEVDIHWANNLVNKMRKNYLQNNNSKLDDFYNAMFLMENMYRDLRFDKGRLQDLRLCLKSIVPEDLTEIKNFKKYLNFYNALLDNNLDLKKTNLLLYIASNSNRYIRKLLKLLA